MPILTRESKLTQHWELPVSTKSVIRELWPILRRAIGGFPQSLEKEHLIALRSLAGTSKKTVFYYRLCFMLDGSIIFAYVVLLLRIGRKLLYEKERKGIVGHGNSTCQSSEE